MIDDKDIEKLSEVFATKKDLKETFVTKEEFEGFMEITATKQDLERFATKEDLAKLSTKTDKIVDILGKMDEKLDEVVGLKHRVGYIENTLNIQPAKAKL